MCVIGQTNEFYYMQGDPDDRGSVVILPLPSCLSDIAALSHRTPDRHLALTQNVQTSYSQPIVSYPFW